MRRWTFVIVGLLTVLTLVSCTTGQSSTSPTATTAAESTEPPEPTATSAMEPSPTPEEEMEEEEVEATPTPAENGEEDGDGEAAQAPTLERDALTNLESYRAQITWETDVGGDGAQEMTMDIAETRDPDARQIAINTMGTSVEFIITPDGTWVNVGGQWQSVPTGNMESFFGEMTFIAPEDINELARADEDADYEFIGTETVNGIQTRHYRVNVNAEEFRNTTGTSNVQTVDADVWIADESNLPTFPVRFIVHSEVEIEGQTGTGTLTWNVQEVNTEFTIEPPEEM